MLEWGGVFMRSVGFGMSEICREQGAGPGVISVNLFLRRMDYRKE